MLNAYVYFLFHSFFFSLDDDTDLINSPVSQGQHRIKLAKLIKIEIS